MKFWKKITKKFTHAFRGFWISIFEESSLFTHLIATIIVIGIAWWVNKHLNLEDWALLTIAIGLVWITELINTTIENLVDLISFKFDIQAKKVKDISASFTFIAVIVAIIVGGIILIPAIIDQIELYING